MSHEPGATTAVWMSERIPDFGCLATDRDTDVCVIGGGITGLSTAYLLRQAGRSVIIVEDGAIGSGETGRTTAHLSNALDDRYYELERLHGAHGARLAAESHSAAIDQIGAIVRSEGIDCDFMRLDGYLFLGLDHSPDELHRELEAALRAGVPGVELLPRAPLAPFDTGPCLRFAHQAQFHPLKYLSGLASTLSHSGAEIYTGTHVTSVEGGKRCHVRTEGGATITAVDVVVATNTPINDKLVIHTKQEPYRTYAIALSIARDSVAPALYWDTADPYHYVRIQRQIDGHDVLIIGGEDHKTGQAHDTGEERFARLEAWARERFAMAKEVMYRWSGQIMEPVDSLAFIGSNPQDADNVYIATGDSGHGMTHGTIAAILIRDLIIGRDNPWVALYDPSRKTARSFAEYARENVNVARQYVEYLKAGEVSSTDEIGAESGAILRRGLRKLAIYRDGEGALHAFSAVCPHVGCIVHWNDTERSWDCPCHGSRFDPHGQVLNGPANTALQAVSAEDVLAIRSRESQRRSAQRPPGP